MRATPTTFVSDVSLTVPFRHSHVRAHVNVWNAVKGLHRLHGLLASVVGHAATGEEAWQ